jgi:hypothetical protein
MDGLRERHPAAADNAKVTVKLGLQMGEPLNIMIGFSTTGPPNSA